MKVKRLRCYSLLISNIAVSVLGEMMSISDGNKLEYKRYTHKPVSPLKGLEAPCCGGGLAGNCLLIICLIF